MLYRGGEKKRSLDSWTVLQGFLSDRAQSWRPARGLVKHLPVMFLRESELSAHRTTGISESTTFQNWEMLHVPALRMGTRPCSKSSFPLAIHLLMVFNEVCVCGSLWARLLFLTELIIYNETQNPILITWKSLRFIWIGLSPGRGSGYDTFRGFRLGIQGFTCEANLGFRLGFRDSLRSKFGIQVGIQGFTAKQLWDSGIQVMGFR